MRIGLVVPRVVAGPVGGAEALYRGLLDALRRTSHEVELVGVPVDESTFDAALESYLACHDLDVSAYDAVISTKVPTYMVRHPNHVAYLVHTMRVFYDLFEREFGVGTPELRYQRRIVHALDRHGLAPERVRAHLAVGSRSYLRLARADPWWTRIAFRVVHHPPAIERFLPPRPGEYVLVPGRLHRWKRVDLVIRAVRQMRRDIVLKIAGTGEEEAALRALAAGDPRIEFLGRVADDELVELYARALAVAFTPIEEDYRLVTIEAFRARKPVLTCTDSGEPTVFVRSFDTGFVVEPTPAAVADRLAWLADRPEEAAAMGERGAAAVAHITWERVVENLLAAATGAGSAPRPPARPRAAARSPLRVTIADMQRIDPAIGGSRLRILGLFGTLCEGVEATYVGTFDWPEPGQARRELALTPRLREIDVPLTAEHFAANGQLNALVPERTIIDVTMPWLVWSSPALVAEIRRQAAEADVVVCSHPWMYDCVRDLVGRGKLLVYDAHNCEARLRQALLGDSAFGRCLVEGVVRIERAVCEAADLVLACSEDDAHDFAALYGVGQKVIVTPNGVDTARIRPASGEERAAARRRLDVTGFVAVFTGSRYPPNVDAVRTIVDRLAPATPAVTYLVVGGAGDPLRESARPLPANVRLLGVVSDETRDAAYAASDVAVNPIEGGSGTNIKMLDFLASGLATVTTEVGARGLAEAGRAFVVDEIEAFPQWIERLRGDVGLRARLAASGRALAEARYDWREISRRVAEVLLERTGRAGEQVRPRGPFFSVVVPSFERPEALRALFGALDRQTFRDFEVIVVDQSARALDPAALRPTFPLHYVHRTERGATRARNVGIARATGEVVAFTDDDCLPEPRWLEAAHARLRDGTLAGLEGAVASDRDDGAAYRIVTNAAFAGFGFMTANLFVRRDVLDRIAGFDERFDDPHFREDTDLAWRALAHGPIPFAADVRVVHPAHPRVLERESAASRNAFFVHDALLFAKHPERYVKLMLVERHFADVPGFWDHFMRGMIRHRVDAPVEALAPFTTPEQLVMLEELSRMVRAGDLRLALPPEF
jgi:glycosyltransferase involved in cell wall biosynthesis/GT2 family glycosyltransferase